MTQQEGIPPRRKKGKQNSTAAEAASNKPGSPLEMTPEPNNDPVSHYPVSRASEAHPDSEDPALQETLMALQVDEVTAERIKKLPHDVGWLLITAGILGVIIPGVLGAPFLALGGLMLWPKSSHRAERWLAGHSPKPLKGSMRQINRFLDDLERRYPSRKV